MFLQLRIKFNTNTLKKHIVPLLPEYAKRIIETRVWRPPEGTETVARNVSCTGLYGEHKRGEIRIHFYECSLKRQWPTDLYHIPEED
jgi:hypothetical protein